MSGSGSPHPSNAASVELAKAKQHLSKGHLPEAKGVCQDLLAQALPRELRIDALYLKAVVCRYQQVLSDAQETLTELLSIAPGYARAQQEQGHLYLARQQPMQAAQAFYRATLENPSLVASWRALESLYRQQSNDAALSHARENLNYWSALPKALLGAADLLFSHQLEQADRLCRQFLKQHKHDSDALYLLGMICIQAKAYDEGEFVLESAVELAPQHQRAAAEYAALLNRVGKYQQALKVSENLIKAVPENLSFAVLKGVAEVGLGQLSDGIGRFLRVLEKEPERPSLWLQLGHAYKSQGELEKAVEVYHRALEHRQDYGDAYWSLANTKAYRFSADELEKMRELLESADLGDEDRAHILFALGKGMEDGGDPKGAFRFYAKGNEAKFAVCDYQPEQFSRQIDRHIEVFTTGLFEQFHGCGFEDPAPIFILGLPRSGSTLLEQILSSHSQVDATQELHHVLGLAKRLRKGGDYPHMLNSMSADYLSRFGQQFIEQTREYRRGSPYFIDKMPNNFLHVGLIKLILPQAKIIDARRDPMDCTYSCFKQLFAEGQDFTYDQQALGQYYRDYLRIMEHWQKVLPGFVLQVDHEDVLHDLQGQIQRMLAFCGLDFEPQCLTFYENQRAVQTPSAAQVRRPINRDGVGRWQSLEGELAPLRHALGLE